MTTTPPPLRPRTPHRGLIWSASIVAHALALLALAIWSQRAPAPDEVLVHASISQHVEEAAAPVDLFDEAVEPEPERLPPVEIQDTVVVEEALEIVDPESQVHAIQPENPMPLLSPDAFRKPTPDPVPVPDIPPAVAAKPRPPVAQPARRPAKRGGTLRLVGRPDIQSYYPYEARSRNIQGETIVLIQVDITGTVVRASVRRSSGYQILDAAAVRVAYAHTFAPGVTGRAELPVRFRLVG